MLDMQPQRGIPNIWMIKIIALRVNMSFPIMNYWENINGIDFSKFVFNFMREQSLVGNFEDHLTFFVIMRYFEEDMLKFNPNVRL